MQGEADVYCQPGFAPPMKRDARQQRQRLGGLQPQARFHRFLELMRKVREGGA